jgi:hypothetical protein
MGSQRGFSIRIGEPAGIGHMYAVLIKSQVAYADSSRKHWRTG